MIEKCEIIFVDGKSSDKTISIISNYMNRFDCCKLIKCDRYGYAYQRNIGVSSASGKYILFISGDVTCQKGMIKRYFNYIETGADIVQGSVIQVMEAENPLYQIVSSFYSINKDSIRNQISTVNIIIRKELLVTYPMNENYPAFEDKLWYTELPVNIKYIRGIRCIVYHKVHESISGYAEKIRREAIAVGMGLRRNMKRWRCYNFFEWVFYELYGLLSIALFIILMLFAVLNQNPLVFILGGVTLIFLHAFYIFTVFIRNNETKKTFHHIIILLFFMLSVQWGIFQGFFKRKGR